MLVIDNDVMILKKRVNWIHLAQDRAQWLPYVHVIDFLIS
jgi:hypothetical protein